MTKRLKWIQKHYWEIYLICICILYIVTRKYTTQNETILTVYTSKYTQNKVLGLYILCYLILLIPLFRQTLIENFVIRYGSHEKHINILLHKILERAIGYSFTLNITFYVIIGTNTNDWYRKENFLRMGILFFTQTLGWFIIAEINLLLLLYIRHGVFAVCLSQFIVILLNLSNYVNAYERLEYYIRMYYFMFHIEEYPSISSLISCISVYTILSVLIGICSYKKLCRFEFI